jgi:hypothetical protein
MLTTSKHSWRRHRDSCPIAVDEAWALSDMGHPGIQRFLEISRKLISLEKPIDVKTARIVLRDRASVQGLCTYAGKSPKALLSDQIVADFPLDWLATVVPARAEKAPGAQLNQVDGVLYLSTSASSVTPYILACSVLFDSADEALRAMHIAPAVLRRQAPRHDRGACRCGEVTPGLRVRSCGSWRQPW